MYFSTVRPTGNKEYIQIFNFFWIFQLLEVFKQLLFRILLDFCKSALMSFNILLLFFNEFLPFFVFSFCTSRVFRDMLN